MRRWLTLGVILLTYLGLYIALFIPVPFLPASQVGDAIGVTAVGVVFAAYPAATALATPLPPRAIALVGLRGTVAIGLALGALSMAAFGLLPSILGVASPSPLVAGLVVCRLVGGTGASLAESAALTAVSTTGWEADLGKALAAVEVVTGVAASAGAALGGALYEAAGGTSAGGVSFLVPCAAAAAMLLLSVLPALALLSDSRTTDADDAGGQRPRPPLTAARVATGASLATTALVCEAINPLLSPHLLGDYGWSVGDSGLYLAGICAAYMLASPFCGGATDALGADASGAWKLKLFMAAGCARRCSRDAAETQPRRSRDASWDRARRWLGSALGHLLLGPAASAALARYGPRAGVMPTLLASPLLGASSAMLIVPSLPDMQAPRCRRDRPEILPEIE